MVVDIREVARRSGVSPATVSRALNGRPDVSEATRERVMKTASDLGYLPNQQARSLVRRRSDTIGLIWDTTYVTSHGRQPFLQDLLVALKMALADTGYHLMLLSPRGGDGSTDGFIRIAAQHSLEGILLMAVDAHQPAVDALIASGRAVVGLDLPILGRRASNVSTDNRGGAAMAVDHLVGLGHRRIAVINARQDMLPAAQRHEGFCAAMARHGLRIPVDYVGQGDFFVESGHKAMQQLLLLPEPPTAVFAAGDQMAVGAMHAVLEAGLEVPRDVSIVGFDDVEIAALVRPALTTISQDYLAMGKAAVRLLTTLIAEDRKDRKVRKDREDRKGSEGFLGSEGFVGSEGFEGSEGFAGSEGSEGSDARPAPAAADPELVPGRLIVRSSTGPVPSA
ncbi:MAG: LacI family transcriptional regulator [Frankiales bacterium]|nr:LacI family transcriptional regulator [Frankiales bacterium]